MAFVVAYVLQAHGYAWLDYGGTDSSVLMSYKQRVANVMPCPIYVLHLKRANADPGVPDASALRGTVIADCSEEHLVRLQ